MKPYRNCLRYPALRLVHARATRSPPSSRTGVYTAAEGMDIMDGLRMKTGIRRITDHLGNATQQRAMAQPAVALARLTEGLWLAIIALVPLFFLPFCLRSFYPPKAMLLQVFALLLLTAAAGAWLLKPHAPGRQLLQHILPTGLHRAVAAFAVIVIIATAFSLTPWISIYGSINRRQGMLTILSWVAVFLVMSSHLRSRAQVKRLVFVVLISSGAVAVIGIVEHYLPSFSRWFFSTSYHPRVDSTTGNALSLSGYLGMAMPLTLAAGVYLHQRRAALLHPRAIVFSLGVLLSVQLWCLVLSIYSFVILLYLLPAALFLALLAVLGLRRRIVTIATLALLAAVVAAGAIIVLPEWHNAIEGTAPYERGTSLERGTYERLHGTLYGRARYWVYAVRLLPDAISDPQPGDRVPALRPLIGYGPETYVITTQRYLPPEYVSAKTSSANFRDRPHNHFIYLAATTGLLGLGAFLAMMAAFAVLVKRLLRNVGVMSPRGLLAISAGCGVAGFLAHAIFNPIALSETTLLWTYLALIPALSGLHSTCEGEPEQSDIEAGGSGDTATGHAAPGRVAIVCVLLCGALLASVLPAARSIMAEQALLEADRMSAGGYPGAVFRYSRATELQPREPAYWGALGSHAHSITLIAPDEAKIDILELSIIAFTRARDNNPLLAFWHYQLGDALLYAATSTDIASIEDAMDSYERALELSPRNAVLANRMAVAHMAASDFEKASDALDRAAEYDPMWSRTDHLRIALTALQGNGNDAADMLIETIYESPGQLLTFTKVCAARLVSYGVFDEVANALQPALEDRDDDFAVLSARAVLFTLEERNDAALTLFEQAAAAAGAEQELEAVEDTLSYLAGFTPEVRPIPGVAPA